MNQERDFLADREGASDSDVEALMKEFGITEEEAAVIFRAFLDSLDGEEDEGR